MNGRDKLIEDLKTIYQDHLKNHTGGICNIGSPAFAAVLTMVDYLNAVVPLRMQFRHIDHLLELIEREAIEKSQPKPHKIESLECSRVLKDSLREAQAENLEDITAYDISKGGVVDSIEYIYLYVNGRRRCVPSMTRVHLEELDDLVRKLLGRGLMFYS